MATQAQHLAEFAERLKFEDIPPEVIEWAKLHILDILGIGLAASDRQRRARSIIRALTPLRAVALLPKRPCTMWRC
jgi:2-methylcitrate dehydratase PrpD